MNKQKILSILKQLYGKDSVIEDGNTTIILGVDFKDRKKRDDVAKYIAKKLKGIEKNRVVKVNQIKILIKPKIQLIMHFCNIFYPAMILVNFLEFVIQCYQKRYQLKLKKKVI